jgi:hypothetical protein
MKSDSTTSRDNTTDKENGTSALPRQKGGDGRRRDERGTEERRKRDKDRNKLEGPQSQLQKAGI